MNTETNNLATGPIAWMARNRVAANLLMIFCLLGGALALRNVRQEVFPEFTIESVTVSVVYPGASPEEVEEGIILPIEEAVQGLEDVDEITSTAREGGGTVRLDAVTGANLDQFARDIENEIDRITTFPDEAEEPEVRAVDRKRTVLSIILYGDVRPQVLHALGEAWRDDLLVDDDITQVDVTGLPELEIRVAVPTASLRRYGLTLQDVANRIRASALDIPAGAIDADNGEVLVRMKERRDYGREFADLRLLTTEDGGELRLGDIAEVEDGFEDTDRYTTFNDKRAIRLQVSRVGNQTPLEVADAARQHVDTMSASLPPGIKANIFEDRSEVYRDRLKLMVRNGLIGLALVIALLGVFLEARLAFWVMMGIPISFLGSFLILPLIGVSINMISMFAYIIALGIVVDDAIVVGENVYSHHQRGLSFQRAAVEGTREVALPVVFSILTNIVAFMPLLFIPGVAGKIFSVIPSVVISAFVISLLECLFILPAHLGHHRERRRRGPLGWLHGRQQAFSDAFSRWVRHRFGAFLDLLFAHRYAAFALASAMLVLTLSYALSGRLGMGLFPEAESDTVGAFVVFPFGTPVEQTETAVRRIVAGARRTAEEAGHPELVEGIMAEIGNDGAHTGQVEVLLADVEVRDEIMSAREFTEKWRASTGPVLGADSLKFDASLRGPGGGAAINIELSHRNLDILEAASAELAEEVRQYPIAKDVDDGFQAGKPQFDLTMTADGEALELTAREVGQQLRNAFYGTTAITQLRGRNEVEIDVRLPEEERSSVFNFEEFLVRTPAGVFVPLTDVADARLGRAYTTIERRDGRRVVQVTADAEPRSRANEVLTDLRQTALPELKKRYAGLQAGFEGREASIRESMGALRLMFVLAMIGIYAMLAIPFGSYVQPLIVLMSVPFGIVGAVLGHILMGYSLSVISLFGVVALAGVVVNDSLILITFANRSTQAGQSPHDAIREGAIQRFRQIVLTSITTFGGLAPLIFETSFQARIMIPMAISLGFGILFALVITLAIVPILYLAVEDVKARLSAARSNSH
ncbi:MAG: efflux RND transporter permease subunit [Verrucomicrobiota bacterium]